MKLSLRTAARIAWRETRSSMVKFIFVTLGVAAGVGALAGVRGFSQSFESMLTREARTVMAADLTARQFLVPNADQEARLDALAAQGVDRTLVTETVSMASAPTPTAVPVLVSIKAVDPSRYPYYGTVKLDPPMPLSEALKSDTIAAGEDVLIRLNLKRGDTVRVANSDGTEIARGIVNYGSRDLARIVRRPSDEIESILGYHFGDEVIHRNDMVLL